ncbi:MAG: TolC family protein, partial [Planctomycetota bacterium]
MSTGSLLRYRPLSRPLRLGLAALGVALSAGCSRTFYREQADAEAYCLVDHKAAAVGAPSDEFRIAVDPRSRMFDPYDPDLEPMPPDDPASHQFMEYVDCKENAKLWREAPQTPFVDNPDWQSYLPRNEDGEVVLDIRGAVELALLESPRYQRELEDLYLSALDVSFERFRFDAQFFGGSSVFYTADGRDRAGGDSSSILAVSPARAGNRWQVQRLTSFGGTIVAGFANSLIWQFAGPTDYTSATLFDFAVLQPLLRSGGRVRVLERLTIAERTLLANVRAMERFRRGFYLNVVTGDDPGQGPSRRGGFFGGAGLEGFTGVGGGGFGGVGNFGGGFGGFGGGGGITGGAGAQGAGGYLGLLQSAQEISNQRANVASLRESVEQLQASYDAGRIDRFQVDFAQQALYTAQSQLLTSETFYEASLESFKISLGLPPELDLSIDDPLLDQFMLLDPELEAFQARVTSVLSALRELRTAMADEGPGEAAPEPFDEPIEGGPDQEDLADLLSSSPDE